MKTLKANWWVLYALLPLAVVLLVVADLEAPTAGWRKLAELAVSLGIFGAMALWVRGNRAAMTGREAALPARRIQHVGVADSQYPEAQRSLAFPGLLATASHSLGQSVRQ